MITANEAYLINELKNVGLEDKQIKQVIRRLAGFRIYIRKKENELTEIKELYWQMREQGVGKSNAIRRLAEIFEKHEQRIRQIVSAKENR